MSYGTAERRRARADTSTAMSGVLATDRRPVATMAPTRRRPPRRLGWLAWVAAGALGATVLGAVVTDEVHAQGRYDTAHAALGRAQQHTKTVSTQLHALQRDLDVLKRQVGSDTAALNQDSSALLGAQTSLTTAEAHVTQQASEITTLQACLTGVEQALNQLATGKQPEAIAALNAVSSSCTAAEAASG
jgi:cob(I)alamin adenosyltransferase